MTIGVVLVTSTGSTSVLATMWGKVINRRDTNPYTDVKNLVPWQEDASQKVRGLNLVLDFVQEKSVSCAMY